MPVTLPSPAEFSGLSWKSRDKAILAACNLLRAYGGAVAEDMTGDNYRVARGRGHRSTAGNCGGREEARRLEPGWVEPGWVERVREEARRLERESNRRAGVRR